MLYDAKGNLISGKENEKAVIWGKKIEYWVRPANEMEVPFATVLIGYRMIPYTENNKHKKALLLEDYRIEIGSDVPVKVRPVLALHEYLHLEKDPTHQEIFAEELRAVQELGVEKEYVEFISRDEVFKKIRDRIKMACGEKGLYTFEDGRGMEEWLKIRGGDYWVKLTENGKLIKLYEGEKK